MLRRRRREAAAPDGNGHAIERAIQLVAAEDTFEHRTALYELFLTATFLVPASSQAEASGGVNLVVRTSDAGPALPVFTGPDTFRDWGGDEYAAIEGRALFEFAAENGIASIEINPGSTTGGTIPQNEIAALARGRIPVGGSEVVAEETQVMIGQPAVRPPDDVVDAVREAVAAEQAANAAWLFLLQQPPGEPEVVIGLELASGLQEDEARAAVRRITDGAGERSPGVRDLGFMAVADDLLEALEDGAGEPIFRR